MRLLARILSFGYSVLLRALVAMGGALGAYGATGMFTSSGIMPPNLLVKAGALFVVIVAIAMWTKERRIGGIWPALLIIGVPYGFYAWGSWSVSECAPDHPPITSLDPLTCSPVGTHAIAIAAPVITLIGLVLFVRDIRALAKRGPQRSETA